SRRGRGKAAERSAEVAKEPEAESHSESAEPETPPKPRLMDSAEHRTTEKHSGPNAAHEVSSPITDDDLVFSRPEPVARAPEPEPDPEPEREPQKRAEPEPGWEPPVRARPKGRSRESIEDQLAADLEAAEVAEPVASSEFGFEPVSEREPFAESEREPAPAAEREFEPVLEDEREPGPRREAESELEVD